MVDYSSDSDVSMQSFEVKALKKELWASKDENSSLKELVKSLTA